MKTPMIFMAGICAVALVSCGQSADTDPAAPSHPSPKPISKLTCPDKQGALRKTGQTPDGLSCDYSDNKGQTVNLKLMPVGAQSAETVLTDVEKALFALVPSADLPPTPPTSPEPPEPPHTGETTNIAVPGLKVTAENGRTNVQIGNLSIQTDDDNNQVKVEAAKGSHPPLPHSDQGAVSVNAKDDTAVIRMRDSGEGIRRSLIIASEKPGPEGYRLVGYEARGPVGGPLVVATIKGKGKHERQVFKDLKALVSRNSGR